MKANKGELGQEVLKNGGAELNKDCTSYIGRIRLITRPTHKLKWRVHIVLVCDCCCMRTLTVDFNLALFLTLKAFVQIHIFPYLFFILSSDTNCSEQNLADWGRCHDYYSKIRKTRQNWILKMSQYCICVRDVRRLREATVLNNGG